MKWLHHNMIINQRLIKTNARFTEVLATEGCLQKKFAGDNGMAQQMTLK